MKVLKAFGARDLRVVEVPVPEPDFGRVRVRVRASGVCGSDKWLWGGKSDEVAGHEVAGVVDALGEGVSSLALGDRVVINNVGGCGDCLACRSGAFVLCADRGAGRDVNNGFGEYVVAPARNCLRILPGLDFIDGALIMDNWGTPFGGIKKTTVAPGTDVLVNGCGPIGQAAIGLCKAMGAFVMAVDPIAWRRQIALRSGADAVFAPEELPEAVRLRTNGLGAHVAMECSGNGEAYVPCLDSLRIGGELISIGEHAEFVLRPSKRFIHRSLKITGTWYSTLPQAAELMEMALLGRINVRSFLTHTVSIDEVPGLFGDIVACADGMLKCIVVFE